MLRAVQVAQIAGVPYRTVARWADTGLTPASVPARGTGSRRLFSFRDALRVIVASRLRSQGVDVRTIKRATEQLAREWEQRDPLADSALVAIDGRLYFAPNPGELWDILRGQRAAREFVMLDVGQLAREAAEKVQALAA